MSFINVSLIAGTALVALPIVLHLIMRRKPTPVEFPALRFVQKRHDTNQRRLRLRHLLLLALRAGVIALLALALARPSVKLGAWGSQEAPVAAALVFDTAPRMQYRHDNQTRLQQAQELGQWLLSQLPPESQIAVLDTQLGPATFQIDRSAANQRIERLTTVNNSQTLSTTLGRAVRLLATSELARKEVYVFTDLARAAWPSEGAAALQEQLAANDSTGVYLIDVGVEQPRNVGLAELRLSAQVLASRSSLSLEAECHSLGTSGKRTVELFVIDRDGKKQKRSVESFDLEADQSEQIEFTLGSFPVGTHQGFVRLVGQDALEADDVRYFSIDVRPPWRVLVAAPKPADRYALYLTEALAPAVFRKRGQARFECQVVELEQLNQQKLDEFATVCLLNPTPPSPALWRKLADYVSRGGGLVIFLGRHAQEVDAYNTAEAQELLPGKLRRQARRPDGDMYLAPRDYQHPVLSGFQSIAGAVPWANFPVFRYWELEEPSGTICSFSDGRPALLERSLGAGRVLTMTTPVSDRPDAGAWNLLPVGEAWPFLILANHMVAYASGSTDEMLNYLAGQTTLLRLDPESRRREYLLTTPEGLKFPLAADLKQHLLAITTTDQVGNYRVQAGGRTSGFDRGFSVNLAPEQTALGRTTRDELAGLFGPAAFRIARTRQSIERDISVDRVGRALYTPMILLVALLLGLESLVANRFYR